MKRETKNHFLNIIQRKTRSLPPPSKIEETNGWRTLAKEPIEAPHDEINMFLKSNPVPVVLIDPFPSQQQLIDHMSNQGNSGPSKEVQMMSSETVSLTTCTQSYDKPEEKKNENPSPDKSPPNGSLAFSSNGPLTIEKPNLDMILHLPKSTLRKFVLIPMSELHNSIMLLNTSLKDRVQCLPYKYSKVVPRNAKPC